MKDSLSGLDGVFTYFVATKDSLGMAKDTMAAKPLVLYESDDLVAMGSRKLQLGQYFLKKLIHMTHLMEKLKYGKYKNRRKEN